MATVDRVLPWRRNAMPAEEIAPLLSAYRSRHPRGATALISRAYAQVNIDTKWGNVPVTGNLGVQVIGVDQESSGWAASGSNLNRTTQGEKYTDVALLSAARDAGVPLATNHVCGMFGLFFTAAGSNGEGGGDDDLMLIVAAVVIGAIVILILKGKKKGKKKQ